MIDIVNLGNNYYNTCSCCSAQTSSMKDIDEVMGHKVANNMFELNFHGGNLITTVRLCDECLKELKDKINEL
jgi:hypothetical protein